jgi:hypothetical protein
LRRVSVSAHSPIPPTPLPLIENVETFIPATLYQMAQCSELYGTPGEILTRAPPLAADDLLKSQVACILTPDEPPERPLESLRETLSSNPRLCYERFERLFLGIRRRRRMTI